MDNEILSEFSIPDSEINAEMVTGDRGRLILDVEVIGRVDGRTIFRKHNQAKADGNFRPENAKQMRERMMKKQDETKDDLGE